jgi:hypothetical protein
MDLYVDIENISFLDVEASARENAQHVSALMIHDDTFSNEETFFVKNSSFDKESKNLFFERTIKSKSGKLWSTIYTRDLCYKPNLRQTCIPRSKTSYLLFFPSQY